MDRWSFLPIHLSIYLSIHQSIYLSIYLSIAINLPLATPPFLAIHPFIHLFPNPKRHNSLELEYNYTSLDYGGYHDIPVILKLAQGKQVRIWLRGRTLQQSTPYLFVHGATCRELEPVSISDLNPPTQSITIHNCGDVALRYELEMDSIEDLNAQNYDFEVLTAFPSEGCYIPAGQSSELPLLFRPLEEKTYTVPL